MYPTPFDTTACRSYNTDAIAKGIKLAMVEDNILTSLQTGGGGRHVNGLFGIRPGDEDTPTFSHPFYYKDGEMEVIFIDTRPFLRLNRDRSIGFTNASEYDFQLSRGILTHHWLARDPMDLANLGELAPLVFCRWLTEAIVRKLGLTPSEQVQVTTVTLFYWYSLFRDGEEFEDREKLRIVTKLTQISNIPATLSMPVADQVEYMDGLASYIDTLKGVIDNPRIGSLNVALLFAILGGSWFGFNVKETIAVATEHPPTFVAIIAAALDNRSYRKSTIGRLVYDNDKRDRGKIFTRNYANLVGEHLA